MVADSGGWPRVVKASLHSAGPAIKSIKTAHHRKRIARSDRDPAITASIAKKKRNTQTAEHGFDWQSLQR
jgi:hypothetical protein